MRVALWLILLLLPLSSGQNETETPDVDATAPPGGDDTTPPAAFTRTSMIVANVAVAVLLIGMFVYVARR